MCIDGADHLWEIHCPQRAFSTEANAHGRLLLHHSEFDVLGIL
jgi:hypothetical protein